jgi:hypothetical protein
LGFELRLGQEIFLFSRISTPALEPTQPPTKWVPGSLPGLRLSGCDVNHSSSSIREVKNGRNRNSVPPCMPSWREQAKLYPYFLTVDLAVN